MSSTVTWIKARKLGVILKKAVVAISTNLFELNQIIFKYSSFYFVFYTKPIMNNCVLLH